jgi:hypothetical protein
MRSLRRHNQSLTTLLTRYLAYCCIWAQAIAACAVLAETDQQRLPVFRVDTQGRTPYEIGAELGRQWKSRFPELEPKLDALLEHRLKGISFTDEAAGRPLPPTRQTAPGGLTEYHREELEGLMSALHLVSRNRLGDGFLSRDELLLIQRLPDLGAHDSGSAFGVYASRSNTGSALVGRNLDGQPWQERMERALEAITVYRGEGRALVNIGFAGNLGITTGFNQSGLFLAYLPVSGIAIQGVTEAASEPIAFTIRRMLETHERIDTASQALSWPIDGSNYSILMADRERVEVLEHAAGRRGRLRCPSSKLQPAMSWRHKQKIAAVGCFALRAMPSGCSSLRDQYRWQRFRTLADLDLRGTRFEIEDIVRIMLDRVGSHDAIYAPTTYQTLVFAPDSAELYLGTNPPTAKYPVEPVMHRYAGLIGESSQERGAILSVWMLLWLLITAIAIVTLWVRLRLRSPTPEAPSLDEDE